jgi:hypothetical protein
MIESLTTSKALPDLKTLESSLTHLLSNHGSARGPVSVLRREKNIHESTFPSEIVRILIDDREMCLLCKYSGDTDAESYLSECHGHKSGILYEAEVYRHVLHPLGAGVPAFYGTHRETSTGQSWFVVQYLDGAFRVHYVPGEMGRAARWAGHFHRSTEARLASMAVAFLTTYDADYYLGFARRTCEFAGDLHDRFPWLRCLCERFEDVVGLLLNGPRVIIHSEYCPENILFYRGEIFPVDWESTAVGAGEIDLAALTDGWWSREVVRRCESEYQRARWPEGVPASFARTLAAARLYLNFHWLGDHPKWTTHKDWRWRFHRLRSAGRQLGLV